jgi:hypothetical protein
MGAVKCAATMVGMAERRPAQWTREEREVTSSREPARALEPPASGAVRDPLAVPATVLAARRRPMAERLELALSWNTLAAELRAGLRAATKPAEQGR